MSLIAHHKELRRDASFVWMFYSDTGPPRKKKLPFLSVFFLGYPVYVHRVFRCPFAVLVPAGALGLRLVAVVSFALSTRRRPIAFGLGRAVVSFVLSLDYCVGFGRLRSRVGGFVILSNFGPRSVLVWSPRAASFFGCMFGGFVFIAPSFRRLELVFPGKK